MQRDWDHLRLLPPPEPEITWRQREWWDAGGVIGFVLIVLPGPAYGLTYGLLSLWRYL